MQGLPNYVQKRLDENSKKINELKVKMLVDEDIEIIEELLFLKKENARLIGENYHTQLYTEPPLEPLTEEVIEQIMENVNEEGLGREEQTVELYGNYTQLYQKEVEPDYFKLDDEELFAKYNIKFKNGLAVNIDYENIPPYVLRRLERLPMESRLLNQKEGEYFTSDTFGTDNLTMIYYESQINARMLKDIAVYDPTVEDKITVREIEGKDFVLLQLAPDFAVNTDYRYTAIVRDDKVFIENGEKFEDYYQKIHDKSKEWDFPVYKVKKIR